jgi:uncharacterized protein (TIGR00730 family)
MAAIGSVCVYCGSSAGVNPRHAEVARQLGRGLAERGMRLIYGGGRIGLMGVIADAVLAGGGQATGVIPEHLEAKEVGHRGVSELRVVGSMHERKTVMFELADAFVILPGGFGTLDEAFEMLTWRQLHLHDKPILFLDVDGYWVPFRAMVDHFIREGFARESSRDLFVMVDDVEAVIPTLLRQPAPTVPDAIRQL